MIRRMAFALAATALAVSPAGAQIGRGRQGGFARTPDYWVGLSYGYMDGLTLSDGRTNATWAFRYASQLRATIEKTVSGGVSFGAAAGFSSPRLAYTGREVSDPCGPGGTVCQASADVTQYMAFVRSGGGVGFHGLFNLEAGATQFSKFRDRTTGATLASNSGYDLTFGFGGGFSYGFSPTAEVYVSEQMDVVFHPQGDDPGASTAPRVSVFRFGARIGF